MEGRRRRSIAVRRGRRRRRAIPVPTRTAGMPLLRCADAALCPKALGRALKPDAGRDDCRPHWLRWSYRGSYPTKPSVFLSRQTLPNRPLRMHAPFRNSELATRTAHAPLPSEYPAPRGACRAYPWSAAHAASSDAFGRKFPCTSNSLHIAPKPKQYRCQIGTGIIAALERNTEHAGITMSSPYLSACRSCLMDEYGQLVPRHVARSTQ